MVSSDHNRSFHETATQAKRRCGESPQFAVTGFPLQQSWFDAPCIKTTERLFLFTYPFTKSIHLSAYQPNVPDGIAVSALVGSRPLEHRHLLFNSNTIQLSHYPKEQDRMTTGPKDKTTRQNRYRQMGSMNVVRKCGDAGSSLCDTSNSITVSPHARSVFDPTFSNLSFLPS